MEALPMLVEKYQIIHQTGEKNFEEIKSTARTILENSKNNYRYKIFGYLNTLAIRMAAGAANIVISRAGASAIFEIAIWKIPSIIVPITDSNGDHQRKNAFAYARAGACIVIEEINLSPNLLVSEINRIMEDSMIKERMKKGAENFSKPSAARKIAEGIITIALKHED